MVKTELSMERVVFLVDKMEDGGFVATCATHGIFSEGDRVADLSALLGDAVACHFGDSPMRPTVFVKWADREDSIHVDGDC